MLYAVGIIKNNERIFNKIYIYISFNWWEGIVFFFGMFDHFGKWKKDSETNRIWWEKHYLEWNHLIKWRKWSNRKGESWLSFRKRQSEKNRDKVKVLNKINWFL